MIRLRRGDHRVVRVIATRCWSAYLAIRAEMKRVAARVFAASLRSSRL